jgi:hypothetical protein
MGRTFRNHFKINKIRESANPLNVLNKDRSQGRKITTIGKMVTTAGVLTGQPEIVAAGTGLTVIGEIKQGKSGKELGRSIGKDIGSSVGGPFAAQVGSQVGGSAAEIFIPERRTPDERAEDNQIEGQGNPDKSHTQQLTEFINENRHLADKEKQHDKVSHPSSLQARGSFVSDVGKNLKGDHRNFAKPSDEFTLSIPQLNSMEEVIGRIVNDWGHYEHLTHEDQNKVLDSMLNTGFFDDMFQIQHKQKEEDTKPSEQITLTPGSAPRNLRQDTQSNRLRNLGQGRRTF